MPNPQLPIWMSRDDFRNRAHNLPLTNEQWTALANGANIEAETSPDNEITGWWVIEIENKDKAWVLLSGPTDVYDQPLTRDRIIDPDTDCAPVWMDSKGHFRLGPGEQYDANDDPNVDPI